MRLQSYKSYSKKIHIHIHLHCGVKKMHVEKRNKSYRITVNCGSDDKGQPIRQRFTFRPSEGLSEREARKAAYKYGYEIEDKIKKGINITYENITFNQFCKLYFTNHAPTLKVNTAEQYRQIYENRLKPYFGNMKMNNITALDVRQWLTALDKSKDSNRPGVLSENSKGVYFRTLSSLFGVAVKWNIINDNPCRRINTPHQPTTVKALQQTDVNKLFEVIDTYSDHRCIILVYIFLLTGIRISELAGLQWQDIDFNNQIIHINREALYVPHRGAQITSPKSVNSNRDIFIPALLCEKLLQYKEYQEKEIQLRGDLYTDKGFLITQFDGSPVHASTIRKWIKKTFAYFDIPYVTIHGLRHTYASLLIANGIDARTAAAQLGHSTPALVMNVYANPQNEAKRRAANMIENITQKKENRKIAPKSPQNE